MRKITKRTAAIATASVVAVSAAGAAFAWSLTGEGSTSAAAAGVSALTVKSATTVGEILPGQASSVSLRVNNPNKYKVKVTSVTLSAPVLPSGCDAQWIKILTPSTTPAQTLPANATIPAKAGADGAADIVVTNAVQLSDDAPLACATGNYFFTVNITADTKGAI